LSSLVLQRKAMPDLAAFREFIGFLFEITGAFFDLSLNGHKKLYLLVTHIDKQQDHCAIP
jgi:hypothetical protein